MRDHDEPMGRRQHLLPALTAAALSALPGGFACVGGGSAGTSGAMPTYAEDVAPRLARSCVPCHAGETSGGPPALTSLDDARRHGQAMVLAVEAGLMPPGGIDRSGACQTFLGPAPFLDEDAQVLRAWLDAGMPAGPAAPPPEPPAPGPNVRADRTVQVTLPLSPLANDAHRCFLVPAADLNLGDADLNLGEVGHLAGLRVEGGGIVHHVMVFGAADSSGAVARGQDGVDGEPGWACPGVPVGAGALVATWVPGQGVAAFPDEAAAVLPPGPLIVQVHQHGAAPVPVPEAKVSLFLVDHARWPVRTVPVAATDFSLPPGQDDVGIERTMPLPFDHDVLVVGVMPHLHGAGRAASSTLDGGDCLVDAPRFDFGFQELAFYETPVRVAAGARALLSCRWDTRGRSSPTTWGESSDDEMCTVFLFVTDP